VYSRAVIDKMRNGQLPNVFVTRGGFNCRHLWRPVTDPRLIALADTGQFASPEIAEQVAAMLGDDFSVLGAGGTIIGITSAGDQEGADAKTRAVRRHGKQFGRALDKIPSVTGDRVANAVGGYRDASGALITEPTWDVSLFGNGEARRLAALFGQRFSQEAVLYTQLATLAERNGVNVDFTFGTGLGRSEREIIQEMMVSAFQQAAGKDDPSLGWTWRDRNGRSVLSITSVDQWGGSIQDTLSATRTMSEWFKGEGFSVRRRTTNVLTEVFGDQSGGLTYDQILSGDDAVQAFASFIERGGQHLRDRARTRLFLGPEGIAQVEEDVQAVATLYDFDDRVVLDHREPDSFGEGVEIAHYDPEEDEIVLWSTQMPQDRDERRGIIAHEMWHDLWQETREEQAKESVEINFELSDEERDRLFVLNEDGLGSSVRPEAEDEVAERFPVSWELSQRVGDINLNTVEEREELLSVLEDNDGITRYSTSYWDQKSSLDASPGWDPWRGGILRRDIDLAVNETVAEYARLFIQDPSLLEGQPRGELWRGIFESMIELRRLRRLVTN
jgi:hypothetical protein